MMSQAFQLKQTQVEDLGETQCFRPAVVYGANWASGTHLGKCVYAKRVWLCKNEKHWTRDLNGKEWREWGCPVCGEYPTSSDTKSGNVPHVLPSKSDTVALAKKLAARYKEEAGESDLRVKWDTEDQGTTLKGFAIGVLCGVISDYGATSGKPPNGRAFGLALKGLGLMPGLDLNPNSKPVLCKYPRIRGDVELREQEAVEVGQYPGACAAPQLIAGALRNGDAPLAMTEIWYDGKGGRAKVMESCETCEALLPRMLCGLPRAIKTAQAKKLKREEKEREVEKMVKVFAKREKGESKRKKKEEKADWETKLRKACQTMKANVICKKDAENWEYLIDYFQNACTLIRDDGSWQVDGRTRDDAAEGLFKKFSENVGKKGEMATLRGDIKDMAVAYDVIDSLNDLYRDFE